MRYSVLVFSKARADIRSAALWMRNNRSPSYAAQWHRGILESIDKLRTNPNRCPLAYEAIDLGIPLRELLYGRRHNTYRILFTIDDQTVNVLRVRHGSQDRLTDEDL